MGIYKYVQKAWKKPQKNMPELWRKRLLKWRREPSTIRIDKPTRIDRARSLGYKAKQGIFVVRQRVLRGGHRRPNPFTRKGRRPKHQRLKMVLAKNYKSIAEERTADKYPNCEVLNSYWVAQDGKHYWYEIILVDKAHPVMLADKNKKWIAEKQHKRRVYRGLTSSARKSRSLRNKGKGAEKARPSARAKSRRSSN